MHYEKLITLNTTGKKYRIAIGTFDEKNELYLIEVRSISDEAPFIGISCEEYRNIMSKYKCCETDYPNNIFIFNSEKECQKAIEELEIIKKLINKI